MSSEDPFDLPVEEPIDDQEPEQVPWPELPPNVLTGSLDQFGEYEVVDEDRDGLGDVLRVDTDGDGLVDVVIRREGELFTIIDDANLDGVADSERTLTAEEIEALSPELWAAMQGLMGLDTDGTTPWEEPSSLPDPIDTPDPIETPVSVTDGVIHGDPFVLSDDWFEQSWNGSCLPASVAQIYMEYTGEQVTDLEFVQLANVVFQTHEGGWVVGPDGVPGLPPADAATLLQAVGIPAQYREDLTLDDLKQAVADGPVMVAVDSGEYWGTETVEDDTLDHVVDVSAVGPLVDEQGNQVLDEQGQPIEVVYLSDTGVGHGNVLTVPVEVFLDAWADSDNAAVICEVSAEEYRASKQQEAGSPELGEVPQLQAPAQVLPEPGQGDQVERSISWMAEHPSWWVVPVRLAPLVGAAAVAAVVTSRRKQ